MLYLLFFSGLMGLQDCCAVVGYGLDLISLVIHEKASGSSLYDLRIR